MTEGARYLYSPMDERADPVEIREDVLPYDALAELFESEESRVFVVDTEARLIYCNRSLAERSGWSKQELLGQTPPFPFFPPEQAEMLSLGLQAVIPQLVRKNGILTIPNRVFRSNGEIAPIVATVRRLVSARSGVDLGMVFWIEDADADTEPSDMRDRVDMLAQRVAAELKRQEFLERRDTPLPEDLRRKARRLTPREQDVLECFVEGLRPMAIAEQLKISPHTVRNHIKSIYEKLEVHSRREILDRL